MSSPIVSVVTPFYNSAAYLEECIRSVLGQSLTNFEYVLVNNVSSDDSLRIAERYAAVDPRIRLLTNERFLTQAQNYNHALELISQHSTYCKIVQADDWIYPTCLEEMVALADRDPSIGIVSSHRLSGTRVLERGPPFGAALNGRAVCRMHLLEGYFLFGSATTLLVRSEIVRSRRPFYTEDVLHEDTEACYEILREWNFGFVRQILSFSRRDNESISSSAASFNPALLDKLIVTKRYGSWYLDPAELESCWRSVESRYLRFLAEAKIQRQPTAFWAYHRKGLSGIGYRPPMSRMALYVIIVVFEIVLNPLSTVVRIVRRLRGS